MSRQRVLRETPLARWWHRRKALQKNVDRRCVICGTPVTNSNLGGYDGRGALSGKLYCLQCADLPKR